MNKTELRSIRLKLIAQSKGALRSAVGFVALNVFLVALGVSLSLGSMVEWFFGQILMTVVLIQSFVLLHEAKHQTLFRSKTANQIVGFFAGILAFLPAENWQLVHEDHHRWTGYLDRDPTSRGLLSEPSPWAIRVLNFCWRYFIPVLFLRYRVTNYWNLRRLVQLYPKPWQKRRIYLSTASVLVAHALLVAALGLFGYLSVFALSFVLHSIIMDPIVLCQHCHLSYERAGDVDVKPILATEHDRYTRSVHFPRFISRWLLLGFDRHELHHLLPGIPGYLLNRVEEKTINQFSFFQWLRQAKRIPGYTLVFKTREQTGLWI